MLQTLFGLTDNVRMKNELPNTLKKLLAENEMSARQLSKETGISISTISDVINGRQISLKNLQILSTFFDVSLDYLVKGDDSSHVKTIESLDFEDLFEGIVKIKISKLNPLKKVTKK